MKQDTPDDTDEDSEVLHLKLEPAPRMDRGSRLAAAGIILAGVVSAGVGVWAIVWALLQTAPFLILSSVLFQMK